MAGRVLLAFILFFPSIVHAGSDPGRDWRTLATEHFRVHYYQGGEAFARKAAAIAEEAYDRLHRFLGFVPTETVEFVVLDDQDSANGYATVYPYDAVTLLAYPPEAESELAYFDDPVRSLITHEFAHIVHMDRFSGLPAAINTVLGKTVLPNGAIHSWFTEGLAVLAETRLTEGGRIGSSLFEMYLRSAALDGTFLDLQDLTTTPMALPRGGAPYLYGSYFLDFLERRFGIEAIAAFIRDYGARIIPFSLNILARRHFGKDLLALYEEFRAERQAAAAAVLARVRAEGEIAGRRLTRNGEMNTYPVFSADSRRILFVRADGHAMSGIFAMDLDGETLARVSDCYGGCGHLSVQGEHVFTTHIAPYRLYHSFGDVWRVRLSDGHEDRLTTASRARDVRVGPDGALLWVTSDYDRVSIVRRRQDRDAPVEVVVKPGFFQSIDDPVPIPGSTAVVFAAARDGQWDLWVVDGPEAEPRPLTADRAFDRDPTVSPDGRWIVFSSDRGGVFNLHSLDRKTGEIRRLTNVLGGAFWPAVSPDGRLLAFSIYGGLGYDVAVLPFDPAAGFVSTPGNPGTPETYIAREFTAPDAPYSPWPSLRPRSIRPLYLVSNLRVSRLGAEISGSDAIGRHGFILSGDTDLDHFGPDVSFSYLYDRWFAGLRLDLAAYEDAIAGFLDDEWSFYRARSWLAVMSASLPIPGRERAAAVSLGYALRWTTGVPHVRGHDPASLEPRYPSAPRGAALTVTVAHDSTDAFPWSISPARGWFGSASLSVSHRALGGSGTSVTVSGTFRGYVPVPWVRDHVLALLWAGALSRGDPEYEHRFGVGGFPKQDVFMDLVNRQTLHGQYLRGFAQNVRTGNTFSLLNAEYRFPLAYVHRGLDTLPVAGRRLWATVFADAGGAWTGEPDWPDLRWDAGAELAFSTSLFLVFDSTFRLGVARGFGDEGGTVVYFLLTP